MAMNKKETAEFEAAKKDALINRALRWTDGQKRDLPAPSQGHTQGYDFNAYNCSVYDCWSESVRHGNGIKLDGIRQSASQNGISMFSTKAKAYRALRAAIEMEAAIKLAAIDKELEALAAAGEQS